MAKKYSAELTVKWLCSDEDTGSEPDKWLCALREPINGAGHVILADEQIPVDARRAGGRFTMSLYTNSNGTLLVG